MRVQRDTLAGLLRRAAEAGARPPIYNAEGLHERLEDISWPAEVPHLAHDLALGRALKSAMQTHLVPAVHVISSACEDRCGSYAAATEQHQKRSRGCCRLLQGPSRD